MRRYTVLVLATVVVLVQLTLARGEVTVGGLRCEYLKDPLGIDVARPRLSWILQSDRRGERQTAYQILVASSAAKLEAGKGDLWDTRKVASDQSIQLRYGGRPLGPNAECFWKVRMWNSSGAASAWSKPAKWTIGLLTPEDWKAKWIGLDGEDVDSSFKGTNWVWYPEGEPTTAAPLGARYFRRVVEIPANRKVDRARLLFTADNECKAFVNGRDIGGRDTHKNVKDADITYRLRPGMNSIAIVCRNQGEEPNPAGMVALLKIEFKEGPPIVIQSDASWKVSPDEEPGWNEPGFDDSAWVAAKVIGPVGMQPWGAVEGPTDRRLPARWLRKEFVVVSPIRRAVVYLSGLGLSELYLNGRKVGDHVLSPGMTEYPKRALYVTYDVTEQLRDGKNAIGMILGNGRFYSPRSRVFSRMQSYGFPKLLLHLRVEHADGSVSEVVSDESWRLSENGPITANNEYDGEEYDARKEFHEWSEVGFDDSRWRPAQLVSTPSEIVSAEMINPIRVTQTLKPKTVTEPRPGVFIFDMGQNMVGWCRLTVSGPAGTRVSLGHAETLQPDGTLYLANLRGAQVTDAYTLKGEGTEIWEPRFTYHGFRFVEVSGFPGTPTLESIAGRVVHDDVESAGEFACSNPLVNQIYQNVVWGVKGNYRSVPTDCPPTR